MQTFAPLLRSCALLALFTGSAGQSVPAGTLDEIRVEFHEMNEVLRNENALKFEELEVKTVMLENKNEALRIELEDLRGLLQSQPRRTNEDFSCMREDEDSGDIFFDGCNVHVRSGGDSTDATPNGKGNLIIGYNKPRDGLMEVPEPAEGLEDTEAKKVETGELDVSESRSGSHNLVIGDQHEYTSYGGIVTGLYNQISNKYSAVVGGYDNAAIGDYSTVTGATYGYASGSFSSISGGRYGTASGQYSSISGGDTNTASGIGSSISGGAYNTASGESSSISGGNTNTASDIGSSISGGIGNTATGYISSISGGNGNTASGYESSISGGDYNTASGSKSSISGGYDNTASGYYSSVLGGKSNDAQGESTVVTGGFKNKAIGDRATVVGGKQNKAWKKFSVVTGA